MDINVICKLDAGFMPGTGLAIVKGAGITIPEEAFTEELFEKVVQIPADLPAVKTKK